MIYVYSPAGDYGYEHVKTVYTGPVLCNLKEKQGEFYDGWHAEYTKYQKIVRATYMLYELTGDSQKYNEYRDALELRDGVESPEKKFIEWFESQQGIEKVEFQVVNAFV